MAIRQKAVIVFLMWVLFFGLSAAVYGPILARSLILRYGKPAAGVIEGKFETLGHEHSYALKVRFYAPGARPGTLFYWVHLFDYEEAAIGEPVFLRYLPSCPGFFALGKYRQYTGSASYIPVFIVSLLFFMSVYILWAQRVEVLLSGVSVRCGIGQRLLEWLLALLCIAAIVGASILVNKVISPY